MKQEISELINKFGNDKSSLLPILEEIERNHSRISKDIMKEVAIQMKLPASEVQSVISFYGYLNEREKGKYIIRLCKTAACMIQGGKSLAEHLEKKLGIKVSETTYDNMFTLEYTNCIGMCDHGPSMLINNDVYTSLNTNKVDKIIELLRLEGTAKEYVQKKDCLSCDVVKLI